MKGILNYIDHPVHPAFGNVYTEPLNNLIRVMNRLGILGRGYRCDALRAKLLFSEGAFKKGLQGPKFERRIGYGPPDMSMMFRTVPSLLNKDKADEDEATEVNYGVDISNLTRID